MMPTVCDVRLDGEADQRTFSQDTSSVFVKTMEVSQGNRPTSDCQSWLSVSRSR